MNTVTVRFYQPTDQAQVDALDAQVQPYRPEDQAEVEAMYARARLAEQTNDRWVPIPAPHPGSDQSEPGYLAFWVAVLHENGGLERIVGMVGAGHVNFDILPAGMLYVESLRQRQDFLELQHLRVAPDLHGFGIGTRLCQTVIQSVKEQGFNMLLVNTTIPQKPARKLYEKLGFRETARTFISLYELIWMEKSLQL